ncbi:MAG: Putative transmembrane protein [uncultured Nocardioidaceae bacterium]|uniref:Transmembrane protein n=1 Tax=uncultured Nocardioidaceae bacterium TaxID=253824 RepID=A0A6J4MUN0_9ACTN|nr:MAG: Putative transmembrane protein [uncultured Nocardioidaceae bacterium]
MTSPMNMSRSGGGLALEFPMSLGVYDRYEQAQKAVDYLSDNDFPVQNVMIVGTDLKQVERVTGRLTTGKVAIGGILSGLWLGLFIGLIFAIFTTESALTLIVSTALFGAVFGLIWALIGYALTRGRRDFTSISQVVATRYEVLVEHKHAQRGREMLAQMPGGGGQASGSQPFG